MGSCRQAGVLIACVALAGIGSASNAALTDMNDTTRTNLLLVSGRTSGWGAVGWYQYNTSGVSQGSKSLFAGGTADLIRINSAEAYNFNGSTVDVAYIETRADGNSIFNTQKFDASGNAIAGSTVLLEPISKKYYNGMDIFKQGANWSVALAGKQDGKSSIFISNYTDATLQSQTVLKQYTSDVKIQALATIATGHGYDLYVGRLGASNWLAEIDRISFNNSGSITAETSNVITMDLSGVTADGALRNFVLGRLEFADTNKDGKPDLIMSAYAPEGTNTNGSHYDGSSALWVFAGNGSGGFDAGTRWTATTWAVTWQGVSEISAMPVPEPAALGLLSAGGLSLLMLRRKSVESR